MRCAVMDAMLAAFLPRWLEAGYEVMVTADHGQTDRGHHGGHDDEMQDFALYYFGKGKGPAADTLLDQLQLAPTDSQAPRRAGPGDDEGEAFPELTMPARERAARRRHPSSRLWTRSSR